MAKLASTFLKKNKTERQSEYFTFHATVAADIDIAANGPENGNDTGNAEIHVFGAGSLTVQRVDGVNVTLFGLPAGYMLPMAVKAILSSGTSATNILILY